MSKTTKLPVKTRSSAGNMRVKKEEAEEAARRKKRKKLAARKAYKEAKSKRLEDSLGEFPNDPN